MGFRTFEENECHSQKGRLDLFTKLEKLAPEYLTAEEVESKTITKHKWLGTRDKMSSTYDLGFRIEGIAGPDEFKIKNDSFAKVRSRSDIEREFCKFLDYPVEHRYQEHT